MPNVDVAMVYPEKHQVPIHVPHFRTVIVLDSTQGRTANLTHMTTFGRSGSSGNVPPNFSMSSIVTVDASSSVLASSASEEEKSSGAADSALRPGMSVGEHSDEFKGMLP